MSMSRCSSIVLRVYGLHGTNQTNPRSEMTEKNWTQGTRVGMMQSGTNRNGMPRKSEHGIN